MKHLGYLKTLHLHLHRDEDSDLFLSSDAMYEDYSDPYRIYIDLSRSGGSSLDEAVAEIKALTVDSSTPLGRLLSEARVAAEAYRDENIIEIDLDGLVEALDAFDVARLGEA